MDIQIRLYKFDMRLAGWYTGNSKVDFLIVSEAFLEHNPEVTENTYDDDKEVSGTYYASVCMKNTKDIEQNLKAYVKSLGGQTEDSNGREYIHIAVNYVLYSEDGNTGTILSLFFFAALFVLCGYLLIYNIFDIGVMQDIQQFGIMKTIGMTGKQIKQLMRRQMFLLSLIGIPVGLLLGYGLGVLLLPVILKNWEYSEEEITIVQSVHPAIFILTIIFVLITVFLSMRRPSKKAAKYSAIETAKYTEIKKKTAEKDIRSIKNIAKSNLQRNKKRTILVFTSLILSIIFVNSLWIISNSFDEEKYINAQMRRDYLIASKDTLNPSVGYIPLGFDDYPISNVYGCNENVFQRCDFFKIADDLSVTELYKKLEEGNYVVEAVRRNQGEDSIAATDFQCKIGDKIQIHRDGNVERELEVIAQMSVISTEYEVPNVTTGVANVGGDAPLFYISENVFKEIYENPSLMSFSFNVDENELLSTTEQIETLVEQSEGKLGCSSIVMLKDSMNGLKNTVYIIGGFISVILGLAGFINFVNLMITNIINRKREYAIMQSISITSINDF